MCDVVVSGREKVDEYAVSELEGKFNDLLLKCCQARYGGTVLGTRLAAGMT